MHHALQIAEILVIFFGHCRTPQTQGTTSTLLTLATTCHTFKELALDVLWEELIDASPIARCLPEATYRQPYSYYSFSRPLTQIEWDILRGYTCRIRSIHHFHSGLDWESVRTFLGPSTTEPLFPNVRHLHGTLNGSQYSPLTPFPSLISLNLYLVSLDDPDVLEDCLESLSTHSPNVRRFTIYVLRTGNTFNKLITHRICRWKNLQALVCENVALDVDALTHLSHMPTLTRLVFMLRRLSPIPSHSPPLLFSNLHEITLSSRRLDRISQSLSRIRLPAITDFSVRIADHPSAVDVPIFLANIQTSGARHTIQGLHLHVGLGIAKRSGHRLCFQDLEPFTKFSNLRRLTLDTAWNVDLTDSELITLASAWPRLENLTINSDWGWWTQGGITPNGLAELVRTCPTLSQVSLAIDTRGYAAQPMNFRWRLPSRFHLNVIDSRIDPGSVPAIAAFLTGIAACTEFTFSAWEGSFREVSDQRQCWDEVWAIVRSSSTSSLSGSPA